MEYKIPMRIVVVSPPAGVNFALENNGNLVSVTQSMGEDITFDFDAVVKPQRNTGVPNFTGAFARGTPSKRFFYVNIGELAGQPDCEFSRRAKIWISTGYPKSLRQEEVTWDMVKEVSENPNKVLMARYMGTDKYGGPSCATTELIDGGWIITDK